MANSPNLRDDRVWDEFLTEHDREVAAISGYGKVAGFGRRPAIIVIDTIVNFCGDRPQPILESSTRWRNSCGLAAWDAVRRMETLLPAARAQRVPIFYSTNLAARSDGFDAGRWRDKNSRRLEDAAGDKQHGNEIVAPISPMTTDVVIRKPKPSVFFGTPFLSYLVDLGVDTVLCCGSTTSGCVRATVLDGFSYNFRMGVIEECTFDRTEASHAINLFDMQQKYADVVGISAALAYLEGLPIGIYDDRWPELDPEARSGDTP